jgi:hypothetical protein
MPLAGDAPLVGTVAPDVDSLPEREPEVACWPGDPESLQLEDSSRHARDDGTAAQSQRCFMDVRLQREKEISLYCSERAVWGRDPKRQTWGAPTRNGIERAQRVGM